MQVQGYPRGGMQRYKQHTWMGEVYEFRRQDSKGFGWVRDCKLNKREAAREGCFLIHVKQIYFEEMTL
jgi:hypothetical protein